MKTIDIAELEEWILYNFPNLMDGNCQLSPGDYNIALLQKFIKQKKAEPEK